MYEGGANLFHVHLVTKRDHETYPISGYKPLASRGCHQLVLSSLLVTTDSLLQKNLSLGWASSFSRSLFASIQVRSRCWRFQYARQKDLYAPQLGDFSGCAGVPFH